MPPTSELPPPPSAAPPLRATCSQWQKPGALSRPVVTQRQGSRAHAACYCPQPRHASHPARPRGAPPLAVAIALALASRLSPPLRPLRRLYQCFPRHLCPHQHRRPLSTSPRLPHTASPPRGLAAASPPPRLRLAASLPRRRLVATLSPPAASPPRRLTASSPLPSPSLALGVAACALVPPLAPPPTSLLCHCAGAVRGPLLACQGARFTAPGGMSCWLLASARRDADLERAPTARHALPALTRFQH